MSRSASLRSELLPILVLILVAGGVLLFASLADEVQEGGTGGLDRTVLLALRNPANLADPVGPPWFEEAGRDITALGSIVVLSLLTFAVAGFLTLTGKGRVAIFTLLAVGGALLASSLLKHGFQRPRPDLVPHGAQVFTTSFPSGHSMLSAAVYLTLGALLARVQRRRQVKIYLLSLAVVLTLLVGASRVYLGVHWPTDVLAGWTAGGIWALLVWMATRWLQQRGEVEGEGESGAE